MREDVLRSGHRVVIERSDLDPLLEVLRQQGYQVLGPVVRDGVIGYDQVHVLDELPVGWADEQEGGRYRLVRRDDQALFGYNLGADSWKQFLFPARLKLFEARRREHSFDIIASDTDIPRYALLGVRACELQALILNDRVFQDGEHADPHYHARRQGIFVVAVNCAQAAATCFCTSMGSGPAVHSGYDLALTELIDAGGHRFLAEAASERGVQVLAQLRSRAAADSELDMAQQLVAQTAATMTRKLDTHGLQPLLYQNPEHPQWQQIADRCLSCANCTMVCPTCFCSSVTEHSALDGQSSARWRHWDSCFNTEFTYTSGGSVRTSVGARYRQWLTHKMASWIDQFGSLGCVGCGRCIAWCPVGIDLTVELGELRKSVEQWAPEPGVE